MCELLFVFVNLPFFIIRGQKMGRPFGIQPFDSALYQHQFSGD